MEKFQNCSYLILHKLFNLPVEFHIKTHHLVYSTPSPCLTQQLYCSQDSSPYPLPLTQSKNASQIPVELFQILKDDAVKVLHSICQQIWKTQQWPQNWERSVFISIPKKGNAKECSNYHTTALISHASKIMLKIL